MGQIIEKQNVNMDTSPIFDFHSKRIWYNNRCDLTPLNDFFRFHFDKDTGEEGRFFAKINISTKRPFWYVDPSRPPMTEKEKKWLLDARKRKDTLTEGEMEKFTDLNRRPFPGKQAKYKQGIRSIGYWQTHENFPLKFRDGHDYYMTANGVKNGIRRQQVDLTSLFNMVIDIDCHDKVDGQDKIFSMQELKDASEFLIRFMQDIDDPLFRMPNTLVITGRGFQLWWAFEEFPCKYLYMWRAINNYYVKILDKFFKGFSKIRKNYENQFAEMQGWGEYEKNYHPDFHALRSILCVLSQFSVDHTASKNPNGLYRLPGAYNSKAKHHGAFTRLHFEKTNVIEWFFEKNPSSGRQWVDYKKLKKAKKKKKKKKKENQETRINFLTRRVRDLTNLVNYRQKNKESLAGYRDLICLYVCAAYMSSGQSREKAIDATKRINKLFMDPLPEEELLGYMSSCLRVKYRFKNSTIINRLDITKEEIAALGMGVKQTKTAEKNARNEKIYKIHKAGMSQKDIAEKFHLSQPNVSYILRKMYGKEDIEVAKYGKGLRKRAEMKTLEELPEEILKLFADDEKEETCDEKPVLKGQDLEVAVAKMIQKSKETKHAPLRFKKEESHTNPVTEKLFSTNESFKGTEKYVPYFILSHKDKVNIIRRFFKGKESFSQIEKSEKITELTLRKILWEYVECRFDSGGYIDAPIYDKHCIVKCLWQAGDKDVEAWYQSQLDRKVV